MNCPKCLTATLAEFKLEGVAVDRCSRCDGIWFDARELSQLLAEDADRSPELDLLPGLDSKLKGSLIPGEFVWEKQVAVGFDRVENWFLFGTLKST